MSALKKSLTLLSVGTVVIAGVTVGTVLSSHIDSMPSTISFLTSDANKTFVPKYESRSYEKIYNNVTNESEIIESMEKFLYDSFIGYGLINEESLVDDLKYFFLSYIQGEPQDENNNYRGWEKTMNILRPDLFEVGLISKKFANGFIDSQENTFEITNLKIDFKSMTISFKINQSLTIFNDTPIANTVYKHEFNFDVVDAKLKLSVDNSELIDQIEKVHNFKPCWKIFPQNNIQMQHTIQYWDNLSNLSNKTFTFDDNNPFIINPTFTLNKVNLITVWADK